MEQEAYPEAIPTGLEPPTVFRFNTSNISGTKREIDLQTEAYAERIKRISDKCIIAEHYPVIPQILNLSRDPEELKRLAKGLNRVAEIISEYDELQKRATVLEVAEKDPSWLAWAFGDFEPQDIVIEDFLSEEIDIDD